MRLFTQERLTQGVNYEFCFSLSLCGEVVSPLAYKMSKGLRHGAMRCAKPRPTFPAAAWPNPIHPGQQAEKEETCATAAVFSSLVAMPVVATTTVTTGSMLSYLQPMRPCIDITTGCLPLFLETVSFPLFALRGAQRTWQCEDKPHSPPG